MNILFHLRSIAVGIGGIEVVSINLANKFLREGHHVSFFALYQGDSNVTDRLDSSIKLYLGVGNKVCKENVERLRKVLIEEKIDLAINQMGLPLTPIRVLKQASKGLNVKVISVYHNSPLFNGRLQSVEKQIAMTGNPIKKALLQCKKKLYGEITAASMRYVYRHSDKYLLLSESYRPEFVQFTGIKKPRKIGVQTNPVTIDAKGFKYISEKKSKEIIFVGRIDHYQKRVYRVIDVWSKLEQLFPDWELTIVGDGEEKKNIEHMVNDLELHHVHFEGFQSPRVYYERASILMLTSEFEGFPLVLAECMSFGVVPVVYGSYSAVYDIIEDAVDGVIVPKTEEGFNSSEMAERINNIIEDNNKRNKMALAAIEKSKNYSIDKIYDQWKVVFEKFI